jgi:hypothetical protein
MNLFYGNFLFLAVIITILYFLACPIFSAWLASKKGYSGASWFFLGLFFGMLALITIGFTPIKTSKVKEEEIKFTREQIAGAKKREEQEKDALKKKNEFDSSAKFKIIKVVALQPSPDISSGIVDWLASGEKVICLETTATKNEEWVRVRTEKGVEGWCSRGAMSEL